MFARGMLAAIAGAAAAHFASAGLDPPAPSQYCAWLVMLSDRADQRERGEPDREGALDQPADQAAAVLRHHLKRQPPKGLRRRPLFELLVQVVQQEPGQASEFAKEPGESSSATYHQRIGCHLGM